MCVVSLRTFYLLSGVTVPHEVEHALVCMYVIIVCMCVCMCVRVRIRLIRM
jgi:hypothetical protein